MPQISSFALQYSNVNFSAIAASTFDLFITEGAPLAPGGGFPAISDAQVAQLQGQGRSVVGYVNVAVTDDTRYYWNPSWTSNGHDTGTPVPGQAPSWLDQAIPIDFDGGGQDALIVEYWDAAWQQIVVDQAVALVQRGYAGVFLDDVGRYYDAGIGSGTVAAKADLMIDLVHAVHQAITAVNANAVVVTNTNPYIVTDNSGGTSGARSATYRADVDFHLIENQGAVTLDHFAANFAGEPLLILQSVTPPPLTYEQAWARGILYTAPDQDYDSLGTFAYPATAGADVLVGGDGPNQISGLGGDDMLYGRAGNDTLNGGEGGDSLDGGEGTDALTGGSGNDSYFVDSVGDTVIEASGGGNDIVFASLSYTLAAGQEIETLATVNNFATTAINLTGNNLANLLIGNEGANVLIGGGGADYHDGRGGNDAYVVDNSGDVVLEAVGGGYDQVYASVNFALTAGQEVEVLATVNNLGTAAINLTGNEFNDMIVGNNGANVLIGGGGADSLDGRGGNDAYLVDNAADSVIEAAGAGNDIVYASTNYTLAAGQEVETLATINNLGTAALDLTGNELNNVVTGNNGNNVLNGGAGRDYLDGRGGNDSFAFTTALGGSNYDTVLSTFQTGSDKFLLENDVFTGLAAGTLSANAFVVGAVALDTDDRIIYNSAAGTLAFDADGVGGTAAVLFAIVTPGTALAATDFTVI